MIINTVTAVLTGIKQDHLAILLCHNKDSGWCLPEKEVSSDEDLDHAASQIMEQSGCKVTYFRQLYTLGKADRGNENRLITTAYLSLTSPVTPDNAELKWFSITKTTEHSDSNQRISLITLENTEINEKICYEITDTACDCYIKKDSSIKVESTTKIGADHIKLINMAMDELQLHVISSGLIFSLLPKEFTLKQVQNVYEIISGEKKDTSNFRRDILKMVSPVGKTVKTYNKYAELYSFNPLIQYLKGDL